MDDNPNKINNNKIEIKRAKTTIEGNIRGSLGELRIEYKDRSKYSEKELLEVKRNKELRDLFYNKVRERQNYLHKCFIKFYYKGLMLHTITSYEKKILGTNDEKENIPEQNNIKSDMNNNISTTNNNNNNDDINKKEETVNNNNANNVNNVNEKEEKANNINTNNINTNTNMNDQDEKKVEDKSENQKKFEDMYSKYSNANKLRKILSQKNKQKLEILRKYFHKFHEGGIILSLRKSTKRSLLYKKIENVDFEIALRTVINNQEMNDITIDENTDVNNFKEALDEKMKDKQFSENMAKIKDEEEKKNKIKEEKINEFKKKRMKNLEILFNKADRQNKLVLKKALEIFYLKSKVLSLSNYERKGKRSKTLKVKKNKNKKKSVGFNLDNNVIMNDKDKPVQKFNNGNMSEGEILINDAKNVDDKSEKNDD